MWTYSSLSVKYLSQSAQVSCEPGCILHCGVGYAASSAEEHHLVKNCERVHFQRVY